MDSTDYINLKHFFGSMREDPKKAQGTPRLYS